MTQAKVRFTSIEEYAALETSDLPECRFELVDGVIIEMGAENLHNIEIASFLFSMLLQFVPHYLIHRGTEIEVSSYSVTCRQPDLMVLTEDTRHAMRRNQRSLITQMMPAPRLVIEVVSPGDESSDNYQRDYIDKRAEYAARSIPEYWLIDPIRQLVMVLCLKGGQYQETVYKGGSCVISPTFPALELTAEQILNAAQ
ncbi:MAG: Uma2 family endonuclease [Cyanobacteria bacterium CRU_2_1]|nr:Uma2 family endonuclease [Cyanobacteria bacterium CRU_2_1]